MRTHTLEIRAIKVRGDETGDAFMLRELLKIILSEALRATQCLGLIFLRKCSSYCRCSLVEAIIR